ncbi:MAG: YggS family pyridoxal phosphate-dependent enzyme [Pseudomonadota bacterium]
MRPTDALQNKLAAVRDRIHQAEEAAGRQPEEIRLLAVSKRHPAALIAALAELGQRDFGENYVSEALEKQEQLADLPLTWHFIGPIQSNKTAAIARHFNWVHSVDRAKILRRLSSSRPADEPPLNVCLQVNLEQEASKSGAAPEGVADLAALAADLPGLRLRGLMCIPQPTDDPQRQQEVFRRLRELLASLPDEYRLDTLSMGMSGDLESAVTEGATWVRIGTALFGARPG